MHRVAKCEERDVNHLSHMHEPKNLMNSCFCHCLCVDHEMPLMLSGSLDSLRILMTLVGWLLP